MHRDVLHWACHNATMHRESLHMLLQQVPPLFGHSPCLNPAPPRHPTSSEHWLSFPQSFVMEVWTTSRVPNSPTGIFLAGKMQSCLPLKCTDTSCSHLAQKNWPVVSQQKLLKKLACLWHNLGIKHKDLLWLAKSEHPEKSLGRVKHRRGLPLRRDTIQSLSDKRLPKWCGCHPENMESVPGLGWKGPYIIIRLQSAAIAGAPSTAQAA